jgi:hypothetical protein
MKLLLNLLVAISVIAFIPVRAQKKIQLASPNKNIVFNFKMNDKRPFYNILFKGKSLVEESGLGLQIKNGQFENELVFGKPVYRNGYENYELVVGKASKVTARYNEVTYHFGSKGAKQKNKYRGRALMTGWHSGMNFLNNPIGILLKCWTKTQPSTSLVIPWCILYYFPITPPPTKESILISGGRI